MTAVHIPHAQFQPHMSHRPYASPHLIAGGTKARLSSLLRDGLLLERELGAAPNKQAFWVRQ